MLVILSPAKTLDESPGVPASVKPTKPLFEKDAKALAAQLAALSEKQIAQLMDISPKLAALNAGRYRDFADKPAHPCGWMFRGDVYTGLDIDTLPEHAQHSLLARVRILSGLYGVLRPSDAMCPYRLEMGTKFKTEKAKDLYGYWGTRVTDALSKESDLLINLASQEYAGVVDFERFKGEVIHAHFKERKNGQVKIVSLFAKKARGTMARWICEHGVGQRDLTAFDEDGYRFDKALSDSNNLVFVRG